MATIKCDSRIIKSSTNRKPNPVDRLPHFPLRSVRHRQHLSIRSPLSRMGTPRRMHLVHRRNLIIHLEPLPNRLQPYLARHKELSRKVHLQMDYKMHPRTPLVRRRRWSRVTRSVEHHLVRIAYKAIQPVYVPLRTKTLQSHLVGDLKVHPPTLPHLSVHQVKQGCQAPPLRQ